LTNEVKADVDVLRTAVVGRVSGEDNSTLVVTVKRRWSEGGASNFSEESSEPNGFLGFMSESDVLGLGGGERD